MLDIHALLNPKSASDYSGTFGGMPDITPEMVAASLAGAPAGGSAIIRAKQGDAKARQELFTHLGKRMAWEAGKRFWKTGPRFAASFDGMIKSAIEFYLPPSTCKRCKGCGHVETVAHQVLPCPSCSGVGQKDAKESAKAATAMIKYDAWLETWADRYRLAVAILSEWEDEADQSTKRQIWWHS